MEKNKVNKIIFVVLLIVIGISVYYLLNPKTDKMPLDQYLPAETKQLEELTTKPDPEHHSLNDGSQNELDENTHHHHHDEVSGPQGLMTANLITQERQYTEKEIKEMSAETFEEVLKDTENRLPLLSDIRALPREALHRTPEPIIAAGRNLGLIKEILNVHPEYEMEALGFYETCVNNKERPTPVRALCLTNVVEIKSKNGETVNLASYPKELTNLVRMITDN